MKNNFENEKWWDENTMSYKSWDLSEQERKKNNSFSIKEVNEMYLESNPILINFFEKQKNEKKNDKIKFSNVLDIGCGWGSSSILLSNIFEHVYSIDISTISVQNAKRNAEIHNKKNITIKKLDAEKIDLENYFDFVYSWGVIHHSVNPAKIYQNMFKSMKIDGRFMIMVYNKMSLRYWIKGFFELFFKFKIFKGYNFDTVQKFYTDGYYHKHYIPSKLTQELKTIGFKDLKYELTHMKKNYLPFLKKNSKIDNFFKNKFGWLLVVTGRK